MLHILRGFAPPLAGVISEIKSSLGASGSVRALRQDFAFSHLAWWKELLCAQGLSKEEANRRVVEVCRAEISDWMAYIRTAKAWEQVEGILRKDSAINSTVLKQGFPVETKG